MARIPNLDKYNHDREKFIKIKNAEDEALLFTKQEFKEALLTYIDENIDFISNEILFSRYNSILENVNEKLDDIETRLTNSLNYKINELVEIIIAKSLTRTIEKEVEKRLEAKLNDLL